MTDFRQLPAMATLEQLARLYGERGHVVVLTGGAVRDFLLGKAGRDLDVLTDATAEETRMILAGWGAGVARSPLPFGVVSCTSGPFKIQVIPFSTLVERWPACDSRLLRGDALEDQLACQDLTINAIAVRVPGGHVVDPFGGIQDLERRLLRCPVDPRVTIASWPGTMLRFARFAAELGFEVSTDVLAAMHELAHTIERAFTWRDVATLTRTFTAPHADRGVAVLRETGVLRHLPERWRERLETWAPV